MRRNFWVISAGIGLVLALTIFHDFTLQIRDHLITPAPAYGQSGGDDLPRTVPEGCEKCQESLDTYWELKDKADELPVIPPYLQDEIDTALQTYLDCVDDCGSEPTPEPTETPTCEDLYGNSVITALAYPQELGSGCVVKLSAFVDTLPNKYIVKWSCGGEGDSIERTASGDGEQEVTADLYVFCRTDYLKVESASCSYTVHDPPFSVTGPTYSEHEKDIEVACTLICECPKGSPGNCPLTVSFDREECRTVTFKCNISGEVGIKAVAAVKGEIGWGWDKQICISTHAGSTVNVPCGWKYKVTGTIYKDRASGGINIYTCGSSPQEATFEASNYSIDIVGTWEENLH